MHTTPGHIRPRLALRRRQYDRLMHARMLTTARAQAQLIGVAPTTISRILDGDVVPSTDFVARACHALGVPLDDLFEIELVAADVEEVAA